MATKQSKHNYFLVPLTALMQHPHLKYMLWPTDSNAWSQMSSLLYNSYAVSDQHPNISIIPVYVDKHEWVKLAGEHQLVKTLV